MPSFDDIVGAARREKQSPDEFFSTLERYYPGKTALAWSSLRSYASDRLVPGRTPLAAPANFVEFTDESRTLRSWCEEQIAKAGVPGSRPQSLLLHGPTGTGKSTFAASLCPDKTWLQRGMLQLDNYRPGDKVIIADDIRNFNFEDWKDFFGGQDSTILQQKWKGPTNLDGPFFFIFICNEVPEFTPGQVNFLFSGVHRQNCHAEYVTDRLF